MPTTPLSFRLNQAVTTSANVPQVSGQLAIALVARRRGLYGILLLLVDLHSNRQATHWRRSLSSAADEAALARLAVPVGAVTDDRRRIVVSRRRRSRRPRRGRIVGRWSVDPLLMLAV